MEVAPSPASIKFGLLGTYLPISLGIKMVIAGYFCVPAMKAAISMTIADSQIMLGHPPCHIEHDFDESAKSQLVCQRTS